MFGGRGGDSLFGQSGRDVLRGGLDDDCLDGGPGNDIYNGEQGNDVLVIQGDNKRDRIALVQSNAHLIRARTHRLPNETLLAHDRIFIDGGDRFLIRGLKGDDILDIAQEILNAGTLDGGDGNDTCTAPEGWLARKSE